MDTLTLLKPYVSQIAVDAAVITENYAAMNSMADDIVKAVEQRAHREFSAFTPTSGRE